LYIFISLSFYHTFPNVENPIEISTNKEN
jgi:hypothetical protein